MQEWNIEVNIPLLPKNLDNIYWDKDKNSGRTNKSSTSVYNIPKGKVEIYEENM